MRRRAAIVLAVLLVLAAGAIALAWPRAEFVPAASSAAWAATPENIARGAYLARAGDCMACHTARGGQAYAGGRPLDTPFGRLVAPNITPDAQTGIGAWSADDFWHALHNGIAPGGRLLYPAFPYPNFTKITRADSDALFAYLRSLAPVRQARQPHALRFPYDRQVALAGWRLLYFTPGVQRPDPARTPDWNRGAYLVEGLGHCAACHSARNGLGAVAGDLSGGLMPIGGWYAPALAPEAGMPPHDSRDLVQLLRTGVSARGAVFGPMAEVVRHSLQHLDAADLGAMAVYLAALPPVAARAPAAAAPSQALRELGGKLYDKHCADCHGADGRGAAPAYPPLAGNRTLAMAEPVNAIRIVLHGGFAPATAANPRPYGMPPYGPVLDDSEVAAVVGYVRSSWGNAAGAVTPAQVNRQRAVPLE